MNLGPPIETKEPIDAPNRAPKLVERYGTFLEKN
jgi:hypothetical protein